MSIVNNENDLYIEKQTSVMTETLKGEEILVVVKQTNFIITVASHNHAIDAGEVSCELVYDSPDLQTVSYLVQPPIKYKALRANEKTLNIECKLSVLSSQHEDHFFRVRISVVMNDRMIGQVLSSPLRCISKLDPHKKEFLKKMKEEKRSELINEHNEKKPKKNDSIDTKCDYNNDTIESLLYENERIITLMKNNMGTTKPFENWLLEFIQLALINRNDEILMQTIESLNEKQLEVLGEITDVVGLLFIQE